MDKANYLRAMTVEELKESVDHLHDEVQEYLFYSRLREQRGLLSPPAGEELVLKLIRSPVVRMDS